MTNEKPEKFVEILATGYKRDILEELVDNPDYTFTTNEISQKVSGSYNSVKNFLRDLERFDIVSFTKKGGSYLIEYNQNSRYHDVIKSLLRADNKPLEEEARRYAEKLYNDYDMKEKDQIKSIILFGSVARGTSGPESDIDILVLADEGADLERVEKTARSYAEKQVEIKNDVVPIVEEIGEFRNNLKQERRFESNVKKDGILLEGEELDEEN